MQAFGPQHPDHERVLWPSEMQYTSIQLPPSILVLLSHNALPSPGDRSAVKTYQSSVTQKMAENEKEQEFAKTEIQRLEEKLQSLQQTRKSLDKQGFVCEVVFAPFRRLPADILYIIAAKFCSDSGPNNSESAHSALLLGQVSRTFRYVVRNTSSFWTKMRIGCSTTTWSEGTTRRMVPQIKHFAELSASLELSIRLEEGPPKTYDIVPIHHSPVNILKWMLNTDSPYSWGELSRVKKLDISSYQSMTLLRFITNNLTAKQCTLPINSLLIASGHHGPSFMSVDRLEIQGILDLLPCLTKLWLETSLLRIPNVPLDANIQLWTRLTVARFGNFLSNYEWRALLALCPNLEAAWFSICDDGPTGPALNMPKYSHSRLKALVVQFRCRMQKPVDHLSLFIGLHFPHLIDLKLQFLTEFLQSPGRFGIVARQLTGIFPALQSLALLNACEIEEKFKYILPLLMGFSTITSLSITLSPANIPEFADFMERRGQDGGASLPNLRALKLKFTPSDKKWVKKGGAALTASLKSLVGLRKSVYAASIERMKEIRSPSPSIPQTSEFKFSVFFNWPTDYDKRGDRDIEFNKAHKYFTVLKRNFGQGDTGVLVQIGEEELPEADEDYLKGEFLRWF